LLTGAFTGALPVAFTGVFTAGAGVETGEPVGDAVSGTAVGPGVHVVLLALQLRFLVQLHTPIYMLR